MLQGIPPLLFALLIDRWGAGVLIVSTALMLGALVSLLLVRIPKPPDQGV